MKGGNCFIVDESVETSGEDGSFGEQGRVSKPSPNERKEYELKRERERGGEKSIGSISTVAWKRKPFIYVIVFFFNV